MNHQIATAAEEQSSVVETLNRNIISIRDIGLHTFQGAQQIADATNELARSAVELQAEVLKFKIS